MRNSDFGLAHNFRIKLGYTYIPDKKIGVVYSGGHFDRIVEPGYHRLKSFVESFQGAIDISGRQLSFSIDTVRSRDGIPLTIEGSIIFKLNPFYFEHVSNGKERLLNFVDMNRSAHKGAVGKHVFDTIHDVLGAFPVRDLSMGVNRKLFQEKVGELLRKTLDNQGYKLIGQVAFDKIILPYGLEMTHILQAAPQSLHKSISQAEIFDNLGDSNGNVTIVTDFDTTPHPEPDAPRTQYRGNGRSPQPPRSNNQSTYLNQ